MNEQDYQTSIWVSLMEFYGVTIFPDMTAPASLNIINHKKFSYVAKTMMIGKIDGGVMSFKEIVDYMVKEHGLERRNDERDWDNPSKWPPWPYKKYYAFYELDFDKKTFRYALGDYE